MKSVCERENKIGAVMGYFSLFSGFQSLKIMVIKRSF